jgi:hypothetical protein
MCPRCGRVRAWTVIVDGRVVAAGRASARGGVGIWLVGKLEDLLPARACEPAASARRLIRSATPDQPDRNWAGRMGGK